MSELDPIYWTIKKKLERDYGSERRSNILWDKRNVDFKAPRNRKHVWIRLHKEEQEKKLLEGIIRNYSRVMIYEKSLNKSWKDYNGEPYVLIRYFTKHTRSDHARDFLSNLKTWSGRHSFHRPMSYEKRKLPEKIKPVYKLIVISDDKPPGRTLPDRFKYHSWSK